MDDVTTTSGADDQGAASQEQGEQSNSSDTQGNQDNPAVTPDNSQKQAASTAQNPTENQDAEPPVRKSKLQYILERKQRKIEKLEKNTPPSPSSNASEGSDEKDDEYDVSPEEEAKFLKVAKKHFGDKLEKVDKLSEKTEHDDVNNEITDFLQKDEYGDLVKEYEPQLRKYALHSSRSQVPLEEIMYGIAGRKLISYGAELARKAMKEAQKSSSAATGNRKAEGVGARKDYAGMPREEFLAEQDRILQGR